MPKEDEKNYRPFVLKLSVLFNATGGYTDKLKDLIEMVNKRMKILANPNDNLDEIKKIYDLDKKYNDTSDKEKVYIERAQEYHKALLGPYLGFVSTITLLDNLWNFEGLKNVRGSLAIGLIKDTIKYGNTSVSMGAAVEHFSKHPDYDEKTNSGPDDDVVFLNCGTGGIKYQYYVRRDGIIRIEKEHKPQNQTGPNSLKIGTYTPTKEVNGEKEDASIQFERNQLQFVNELTNILSGLPDKMNKPTRPPITLHAPIVAFVTGTVRAKWEKASKDEKKQYDLYMENYFGGFPEDNKDTSSVERIAIKIPHPSNEHKSYYMEQNMEGNLELLGTRQMYKNIVAGNRLDQGTVVIATVGIGKGSCQFSIHDDDINRVKIFSIEEGMSASGDDHKETFLKEGFGRVVTGGFTRNNHILQRFISMCAPPSIPVIALKSGASLFFESCPDIKNWLIDPSIKTPKITIE